MNWLTTLVFAVLLLTIQYDAASSTSSKSPWGDPDKASSFMDCLITKIVESENFPQDEKEDLKSIMDTLMSAINGANARGKSSGPQMQAINMAIASSLAEIVVAADADNPTNIAAKTQDLAGGLEQCFESVMGTIDRKFIGEINDLISMFAKEAASEIEDAKEQGDPSSSSLTETANKSAAQPTPTKDGDQAPKSEPIEDETQEPKTAPSDVEPQVSKPEPDDIEPQDSQISSELISGTTNELVDTLTSRVDILNGTPQQSVRTAVYPNRSPTSSYRPTSQSSANTYQSSQTNHGSSETARGYGSRNRRPEFFESPAIAAGPQTSKPDQNDVGPQVLREAPGFISREANKLTEASTRRAFQGNGVPHQTASRLAYPNRLFPSATETTSQSAVNIFKSSSKFQEPFQTTSKYGGTYSGPQFSKPTPIDVGLRTLQAAPRLISRKVNEQGDTSTRRVVNEQGDTSTRRVVNEQGDTTTRRVVNEQRDTSPQRVVNEQGDTSPQIGEVLRSGVPQQTKPRTVNPKRSSSSSQATSQSADSTYQSSQTFKDRRYGRRNRRPEFFKSPAIVARAQVLKSTQNDVGSQTQPTSGRIWKVGNKLSDTSTRVGSNRSGRPQQTIPAAEYQNRSSSSSYEITRQSAANDYQSSRTYQGSSETAGGYGRRNHISEFPEPPAVAAGPQAPKLAPNDIGPQASREKPGFVPRVANKLADTSTRRVFLGNGVPQQAFPTAVLPNTPSSSTSRTSQFSDNTSESSQTSQDLSQTTRGYGRRNRRPDYFEPPAIAAGPQDSKPTQNNFGPQVLQEAPGLITRVADELADTSTRITGLRNGVPQHTVSTAEYPNKSSYRRSQSADKSYQSTSQTFQDSSQITDEYRRRYRKPQLLETTAIDVGPQGLQAAPGLISRVVNGQGDTSTRRVVNDQRDTSTRIGTVLRGSAPQQTIPTAEYPKRPYSSSFQTSQSAANTYQSSQTFQGSSQTTGGYRGAYSGPQMTQPEQISDEPQIPQAAPGLVSSPGSQDTFNERSCNDQLRELPVVPTLNSPNGLRSGSAAARISQMISAILNAVGPSSFDVDAVARSLQASVSNLRNSGMSTSDAKLEVLLELIVGLLQIVSNAQVQEINTTTASAVTNAAARCFELALA